jgi:Fe-S cluster assembly scaffold protein SufB
VVSFSAKGGVIFRFHVARDGFLRLDFRPQTDRALEVELVLERDAEAAVRILYYGEKNSSFTCRTLQRHIGHDSKSTVEVKCVCKDKARVNYFGKIEVPKHISAVKAIQENKGLVFSEDVCIHTEPAMDVWAKDVECSHGAAVGGIDPEILHYFSLRGMEELAARELFIAGFFN